MDSPRNHAAQPLWKKVFNTRTATSALVLVSVIYCAYVQQVDITHHGFYWDRLIAFSLSLLSLCASLYTLFVDSKNNRVRWITPTFERPWLCYHVINGQLTHIPYYGHPMIVVGIVFGLCQTGLTLGAFLSLQRRKGKFALKFCLPTVVFATMMFLRSFFSERTQAAAVVRCQGVHHTTTGYIVGAVLEGTCADANDHLHAPRGVDISLTNL